MINDPTLPETDAPLETAEPPMDPPADNAGNGNFRPGDNYDGPKIEISEEMRNSYLGYAMSTIISRALPDVRDGLKPVQRRILYAMRDLNLTPANRHLKSAKIVGECIGNYHPHGDQAIYMTMVRMAQPFSLRYPLVDGQGNFGCFTGDTRIKMMDGTEKSFEELAALGSSATFYVYSVDAQGKIVPGVGRNSRVTRRAAKLVEVTLDNGQKIRCTPDHRFLLRDGRTYKEAQHLTPADSLMPGYFDNVPIKTGLNEYLRIQQPLTGEYEFVHRMADGYNERNGLAPAMGGAFVRHHKNFDRFDNRPDNVERLDFLSHLHLHSERLAELWQDENFRAAQRDGVRRYYDDNPDVRIERRKRMTEQNQSAAFRQVNGQRVAAILRQKYADSPEARAEISRRMKALWDDEDYRAKMSDVLRGVEKRPLSPEEKARVYAIVGEKSRAMWGDEAKRNEIVAAIIAAMALPELRAQLSENARVFWQDPEYRAKFPADHHSRMAKTLWAQPGTREAHREKIAEQWTDEAFRTAHRDGVLRRHATRMAENPDAMRELAALSAESLTKKWRDGDYRRRVLRQKIARYASSLVAQYGADEVTPEVYTANRKENWIPRLDAALNYFDDFNELLAAGRSYNHRMISVRSLEETADVYDITVDEHHNFLLADGVFVHNSIDDDPPAAYRYTEARMTALAVEMLEDIEKNTVDFEPTFDNERMQPTVLPGKFPHLICNGGSGIAVAMANNMAPHNLTEVCDAATYLLERPEATIEQLMQFIPGPDFPTHGLILGSKGIRSAYETGRGSVTMQAKTMIEPMDGGKNAIIVTELPYQVIKKKLIEDIADLVKEKKVDGITALNDFSDRNGMRVVIELRRDVIPQKVLNYLLKHTQLRLNFGVIMLSLINSGRAPRTLSLKGLLQEYLDHRRVVITRRTKFELNRAKARAHILEGLQIAVQFLDEVIQIIRASNNTDQARVRLIERFLFSGLQVEAILNMQLRQLTALEQDKIEGEYRELLKEVGRLDDILSDPRRVDAIVKADLKYLKDKYGDERRTRIIPTEAEEINIEDLIADEEMLLTVTRDGYIKRMPMDTFPSQHRGGKGRIAGKTKEEDNFEHVFRASTHDYILFFTDRGRVYRLKAYDVPQTSRQAMGTAIVNLIQIQSDERITATIPIRDLRAATGFLLMVTARGEVKRTKMEEYANLRANGLITFDLEPNDRLGWVKHTDGKMKIILTSVKGMAIQFHEEDAPSRGRGAGGVRGMTLDGPDDRIVTADLVPEKSELLVVSRHGYGKRTPMSEYRLQSRGGKGIKTMDITDKTGPLVQACVLESSRIGDLRLVIVTEQGIGIRMKVAEVRQTSTRSTQGVKLIELAGHDFVKNVEYLDVTKKDEVVE